MARLFLTYVAALIALLAPDAVWITLTASRLYRPALGDLLAPQPILAAAALFYLLYAIGVVILTPGRVPALRGALLGLCAYGTNDLTNEATLRHWPTYVTVADMAWGTILTAFAAFVADWARRR